MPDSSDYIQVLRKDLQSYLESRSNLSIRSFSKISGVNRYFLSKLLSNADDEPRSFDFNQVYLLTQFLSDKNIHDSFESSKYFIKKALISFYGSEPKELTVSDKISEIPDQILYDFDYFVIFCLVSIETMNLALFESAFPSNKLHKVEELIELGYLKIEEDRLSFATSNIIFSPPKSITNLHLPEVIKQYFSSENSDKEKSISSFYFQGLNLESWDKAQTLYLEFMANLSEIFNDPKNQGNHPVFCINVMDSFLNPKKIQTLKRNTIQ